MIQLLHALTLHDYRNKKSEIRHSSGILCENDIAYLSWKKKGQKKKKKLIRESTSLCGIFTASRTNPCKSATVPSIYTIPEQPYICKCFSFSQLFISNLI